MSDFEWIDKPTSEELDALMRYKDNASDGMNQNLRSGNLSPKHEKLVRLLDAVIQKGRCTCPLMVYRAESARYVPSRIGNCFCDQAFLSTSTTEEAITELYPEMEAAKLVIAIPRGTPMAKFEYDSAGGEERERLLPRGTNLVVTVVEQITKLQQILREQCTSGKPWLNTSSTLLKVHLRLNPQLPEPNCSQNESWTMKEFTDPLGIMAYGSLIKDPGVEIEALIVRRVSTQTPFPVEYARLSRSRGDGPTVVPHPSGRPVQAEILVMKDGVSLVEAKNLLWRRETRNEGSGKIYVEGISPNSVLIKTWNGIQDISHVLYTDFPPSGKLAHPNAQALAKAAVMSVAKAPLGKDAINYLIQLTEAGVETALTAEYRAEILRLTKAINLQQALSLLLNCRPIVKP